MDFFVKELKISSSLKVVLPPPVFIKELKFLKNRHRIKKKVRICEKKLDFHTKEW